MKHEGTEDLLWRAIDLIAQEIGPKGSTSQWFRDEWKALVLDKLKHDAPGGPPEPQEGA